jgi:hypothetical protein
MTTRIRRVTTAAWCVTLEIVLKETVMLSANRIALAAGLLLGALVAVTTLSSGSNGKLSETFAGTVAREGVSSHSFTVEREGAVEVTLTALRLGSSSDAAKEIGLGLGTPTPLGSCALVEAIDSTRVSGQIGGTLQKGTYCVAVYDSGDVSSDPADYTVSVTEE